MLMQKRLKDMQSAVTKTISRRQFLRGNFRQETAVIRPPWALPENVFIQTCSHCNKCLDTCPEKIIVKGDGGFPMIDFDLGSCTFCQKCVVACDDGALLADEPEPTPWNLIASISTECISLYGVTCHTCSDSCQPDAISFHHQVGGINRPEIDTNLCTGCGSCVASCPVKAIRISEKKSV